MGVIIDKMFEKIKQKFRKNKPQQYYTCYDNTEFLKLVNCVEKLLKENDEEDNDVKISK